MTLSRPIPPELPPLGAFQPAPELGAWARASFIDEGAPLENPRHEHLREARIGWLWTNFAATHRGQLILGECKLVAPLQERWSSAMTHYQIMQWFRQLPDFTITIQAEAARDMDDWSFCALIEHELCHAAQATDIFGMPRFTREGFPIYCIAGHDVEQFVDVTSRYGAAATGVSELVRVANRGPTVGEAQMDIICGTCSGQKRAA